ASLDRFHLLLDSAANQQPNHRTPNQHAPKQQTSNQQTSKQQVKDDVATTPETGDPCVFLDRDGTLIEDAHLVHRRDQVVILPGTTDALLALQQAGFRLIVVTNQAVVARGMATEEDVRELHAWLDDRLRLAGVVVDEWRFCPHHPNATLAEYRCDCDCRKPLPGMLVETASRRGIRLSESYMIGDRPTDVAAGAAAGCRTVLVQTGRHEDPLIESARPIARNVSPDHACLDLPSAAAWIQRNRAA
ncbi:MAG: HAD family hydrolase, partial [Planctomycetales bacterium]